MGCEQNCRSHHPFALGKLTGVSRHFLLEFMNIAGDAAHVI